MVRYQIPSFQNAPELPDTLLNGELSGKADIVNISSVSSVNEMFKKYGTNGNIPLIGFINWDAKIAPDRNVCVVFLLNYRAFAISITGKTYDASPSSPTWTVRN